MPLPLIPAAEALERLRTGNDRFAAGQSLVDAREMAARRSELADGQHPFATIFGCSDSRVPAELVFDQGLGDLFVIRVAGNVVAPSLVDSVEFASTRFGTSLVVVLGHSSCGAVLATLEELLADEPHASLRAIVERIRPAVEPVLRENPQADLEELASRAGRANIRASVAQLRRGSGGIVSLIREGRLEIVGAEYCLESGRVEFLNDDTTPAGAS